MSAPNVILLVLDAVRADHLSCYGHERETTPNLDEIADRGVLFENAFANSNWTPTSHGAMFTEMLPSHSGVYSENPRLPDGTPTLPERMRDRGYRTFATSAGIHIRRGRGYERGFDVFQETYRIRPSKGAILKFLGEEPFRRQTRFTLTRGPDDKTLYKFESLKDWISADDSPFFAFINCKTAHNPYNPPRPFKSAYCPGLSRPSYEFVERLKTKLLGESQSVDGMNIGRLRRLSHDFPVEAGEFDPTPDEWRTLEAWYDGAIRYLDRRIGELVDFLESHGEMENTYFIVTSDHGELFGEHGLTKHTLSLYDPVLRVPLVVSPPEERDGDCITGQVSLLDIFPTILDIAGAEAPNYEPAESLLPLEERRFHDYTYAEVGEKTLEAITRRHPSFDGSEHNGPLRTIRDDEHKLISSKQGPELYDWRNDPEESDNLVDERPAVADRLSKAIDENLGTLSGDARDDEELDDELEEHLRHLGYR